MSYKGAQQPLKGPEGATPMGSSFREPPPGPHHRDGTFPLQEPKRQAQPGTSCTSSGLGNLQDLGNSNPADSHLQSLHSSPHSPPQSPPQSPEFCLQLSLLHKELKSRHNSIASTTSPLREDSNYTFSASASRSSPYSSPDISAPNSSPPSTAAPGSPLLNRANARKPLQSDHHNHLTHHQQQPQQQQQQQQQQQHHQQQQPASPSRGSSVPRQQADKAHGQGDLVKSRPTLLTAAASLQDLRQDSSLKRSVSLGSRQQGGLSSAEKRPKPAVPPKPARHQSLRVSKSRRSRSPTLLDSSRLASTDLTRLISPTAAAAAAAADDDDEEPRSATPKFVAIPRPLTPPTTSKAADSPGSISPKSVVDAKPVEESRSASPKPIERSRSKSTDSASILSPKVIRSPKLVEGLRFAENLRPVENLENTRPPSSPEHQVSRLPRPSESPKPYQDQAAVEEQQQQQQPSRAIEALKQIQASQPPAKRADTSKSVDTRSLKSAKSYRSLKSEPLPKSEESVVEESKFTKLAEGPGFVEFPSLGEGFRPAEVPKPAETTRPAQKVVETPKPVNASKSTKIFWPDDTLKQEPQKRECQIQKEKELAQLSLDRTKSLLAGPLRDCRPPKVDPDPDIYPLPRGLECCRRSSQVASGPGSLFTRPLESHPSSKGNNGLKTGLARNFEALRSPTVRHSPRDLFSRPLEVC
ncbi:hypothetical protein ESCO_003105 [Escovopsis weberi]|uniref:Uncharacterized protein n=1 Tax=Escovopsis weberi TaxID=150374 RepID=A0A0M8MSI2_ESCWE|nr:hypothetical protein ESCO_003105 [Escovopsis weberi]